MSGQGAIPEDHPLAIGFTGVVGTRPANHAARRADALVAVGTRFPEMDASSWRADSFTAIPPAKLIHVDVDPNQMDKLFPAEVGLVGDAAATLEELAEALRERGARPAAGRRGRRSSPESARRGRRSCARCGRRRASRTSRPTS